MDFPDELEEYIIQFLPTKDLFNIMVVCHRFYGYTQTEKIWNNLSNSLVTPNKIDLNLHSIIRYGESVEKWKKMYRILKKSKIIREEQDLFDLSTVPHDHVFFYPGRYHLLAQSFARMSIIGLGSKSTDVIFQGGKRHWGVINFDPGDESPISLHDQCFISNIHVESASKDQNHHLVCIGRSVNIISSSFDGNNAMATSVNIFGDGTLCKITNCEIMNAKKHGIYCGQGARGHFDQNVIKNAEHSGIHVVSRGWAHIEGNDVSNCQHHGIFVNYSSGAHVVRNYIHDCVGEGIMLDTNRNVDECLIEFNMIRDCGGRDVERTTSTDDCIQM